MKLKFFVVFLLLFMQNFAQKNVLWFSVSPKGGFGSALFLHKESIQDDNITYSIFNPSYFGGLKFGLTFGFYVNLYFEATYNNFSQKFQIYNPKSNNFITEVVNEQSLDFGGIIRFNSDYGFFFELGGQATNPLKVNMFSPTNDFKSLDITTHFLSFYPNLLLGFGLIPYSSQIIDISIGLRFNYTPINVLEDDFYLTSNYFINRLANYSNPNLTQLRTFLFFEITYYFAYYGKAGCGKHRFLWNKNLKSFRR